MRIGVNALYLIPGGVGGTEIYLRSLLTALAEIDHHNHYFVFTNRETGPDLVPPRPNFTHVPQAVRAVNRPARLLWEQSALPLAAARLSLDVLFNPGFTAPLLCGCPQVTVFHDMQHKRHPEYFRWFDLPFWNFFLFWSATVSRRIVAVSGATADDLRRWYRLPPAKIRIVPSGVDPRFFELAACRCPEPFLLAVSTLHPHKNLDGLLRAFAVFRQRHPEYRLVVSGIHGFFSAELHALRDRLHLADCVEFPGWIPREQLYGFYARADAFLYPSLFEGFGLPVLEALAAGVPTGCSQIEPVNSIAAGAALKFDPRDPSAIAEVMHRLVADGELRERLAVAGPLRAAEFSWRTTAEGVLDVFRDVC
ncbi:MAG: glycosyltransferase family 1 protein [Candidatus Solibacter sp.]|nr:glycosyltransferase family 1 protein [Candidatus Solibacter sp.]